MSKKTDFYGGTLPHEIPAYTVGEVASYLQLPNTTVRAWTLGMNTGRGRFQPVCTAADAKVRMLSFENLIEVHVLSSLRREHEVKLDAGRKGRRDRADRWVPASADVMDMLVRRLKATPAGQPLFPTWLNVRRDLKAACKRAGIAAVSLNDLAPHVRVLDGRAGRAGTRDGLAHGSCVEPDGSSRLRTHQPRRAATRDRHASTSCDCDVECDKCASSRRTARTQRTASSPRNR